MLNITRQTPSVDLHFHSIYSEGALTPARLAERLAAKNIRVASLTDHNTINGIKKMIEAGAKNDIKIIPGVEIYIKYKKYILHLLGYNFNIDDDELYHSIHILCHKRQLAVKKSMLAMQKQGFNISFEELHSRYPHSHHIGLGQIIDTLKIKKKNRALLKKHFQKKDPDFWTIIKKYFAPKKPAHLPLFTIPAKRAITALHRAGGIAVLAHPGQQLGWGADKVILELKKIGLNGIEAFSPYHTWHGVEHYLWLARKHRLLITGGTDYHNDLDPELKAPIKNQRDYYHVPYTVWTNLKKHLN